MFNWIRSLFGKGKVRIEFKGIARNGDIVTGDAKMPYFGVWDEDACLDYFTKKMSVDHSIIITRAEVVARVTE